MRGVSWLVATWILAGAAQAQVCRMDTRRAWPSITVASWRAAFERATSDGDALDAPTDEAAARARLCPRGCDVVGPSWVHDHELFGFDRGYGASAAVTLIWPTADGRVELFLPRRRAWREYHCMPHTEVEASGPDRLRIDLEEMRGEDDDGGYGPGCFTRAFVRVEVRVDHATRRLAAATIVSAGRHPRRPDVEVEVEDDRLRVRACGAARVLR
ncbi:MAG: hypothetical protein H6719_07940 [Sandaracinaceae bacterium]|nr:hypothetical protein [Sandaracinaceae bacterium]